MPKKVPRRVRRTVFGRDPKKYDRARLPYPKRVYEILTTRCGLHPGAAVFEIGPGTGIATRELLRRGADPLTLVEADRRLAHYLADALRHDGTRVRITVKPFERATLPSAAFDLGIAASSFHWIPQRLALRKVARLLKPGGWWADWNNHHGDPYRSGPFSRALQPLYRELAAGHAREEIHRASATKYGRTRMAALKSVGKFDHISRENIRWSVTLKTTQVSELWATFSDTLILPPKKRRWFLSELERIVDEKFGGKVDIPMLTPIYTARRV
jgi:SAM-dependent methyltransferase